MRKSVITVVGGLAFGLAACGSGNPVAQQPGAETIVTIPHIPFSKIVQHTELVLLPGDKPAVSEAQAEKTARQWAKSWAGRTVFSSVTLARLQDLNANGSRDGAPGPLQWEFAIIGPDSFSRGFGGSEPLVPGQRTPAPAAYPYPAHYVIISINAVTGQEDGMTLT